MGPHPFGYGGVMHQVQFHDVRFGSGADVGAFYAGGLLYPQERRQIHLNRSVRF